MKKLIAVVSLAVLTGCGNLPDNSTSFKEPGVIQMKYIGQAQAGAGDPINGCRVYGYSLDGYYQTAVLCGGRVVSGSSAHHQRSDDDAAAAQ